MIFAIGALFSSVYLGVCFYLSRGLKNIAENFEDPQENTKGCAKKNADFCGQENACRCGVSCNPPLVSIIICARNEEKNIGDLLECLMRQNYPQKQLQIIVADDRSEDKTAETVLSYKDKIKNLRLVQITETQEGTAPKKHAFNQALSLADGEIILQTDADSRVGEDWTKKSVAPFEDGEIALSQGIVKFAFDEKISLFLKIYQNIDFLSHGIVAAAGVGRNLPFNANANNFAFRKKDCESLGGYGILGRAVGGDDGLLMQKFQGLGKKIFFNVKSTVKTAPEYSWKSMINQRIKWGSETAFYRKKQIVLLGAIFGFYCFALFVAATVLALRQDFWIIPALFAVKIAGELFFMLRGLKIFGEKSLLPHIIWTSPINLFLTVFCVFCGFFSKFEWKGEKFRAKIPAA